jgi:dipeptidase
MVYHRQIHLVSLTAIAMCAISLPSMAQNVREPQFDCFAVVAGKLATADGSVITAHNEDVNAPAVNLYKIPASTHAAGEQITLREGGKVPQAASTLGSIWINVPGWDVCDAYVNEHGVAVSSDGCPSREDKPELVEGGILFWLRRIVADRALTAREGVRIATGLIDRFGYASSGRSYVIADRSEAWILAVVNGKHWVAQRVPDDKVVLIPNCFTIQGVDLKDTANFMGSPDLVEYAVQRGWYDPVKDGAFNFARAYSNPHSLDHPGNIYRHWSAIRRVSGKDLDPLGQLPFAVTPNRKLTVQDVVAVMRDHFEGTARDSSANGTKGDPHKLNDPTICADGTRYSFVAQLRSGLPDAISSIVWLALHNPDVQGFSAWYPSVTNTPEMLRAGDHRSGLAWHLDTAFALDRTPVPDGFKRYVELNDRVRQDFIDNYPVARKAWREFESDHFESQKTFENSILATGGKRGIVRVDLITRRCAEQAAKIYKRAGVLLKGLP